MASILQTAKEAGWGHTSMRVGGGILGGAAGGTLGGILGGLSTSPTVAGVPIGVTAGGAIGGSAGYAGGEALGDYLGKKILGDENEEPKPAAGPTKPSRPLARVTSGDPAVPNFYARPGQGGLASKHTPSGSLPPGGVPGYPGGYPGSAYGDTRIGSLPLPYKTGAAMTLNPFADGYRKEAFIGAALKGGLKSFGQSVAGLGKSFGKWSPVGTKLQNVGGKMQRPANRLTGQANTAAKQEAEGVATLMKPNATGSGLSREEALAAYKAHGNDAAAARAAIERHKGFTPAMQAGEYANRTEPGWMDRHQGAIGTATTLGTTALIGAPLLMGMSGGGEVPQEAGMTRTASSREGLFDRLIKAGAARRMRRELPDLVKLSGMAGAAAGAVAGAPLGVPGMLAGGYAGHKMTSGKEAPAEAPAAKKKTGFSLPGAAAGALAGLPTGPVGALAGGVAGGTLMGKTGSSTLVTMPMGVMGAPEGKKLEGLGRGWLHGAGIDTGATLGSSAGMSLGMAAKSPFAALGMAGAGALAGGYGGHKLTKKLMGKPSWEKEEKGQKTAHANPFFFPGGRAG